MEQEDIRTDNPMLLYRQLKSGLAEGQDIVTDTTQVYDKYYKLRQSEINKYLLDNVQEKQQKTLQVTLYKISDTTITLSEEQRNYTINQMLLDGWQYSSSFNEEGLIYQTHALKKSDNTLEDLEDGFKWTQAQFYMRSYVTIPDIVKSAFLTIYVVNCADQPKTPTGGSYNFDTKHLTGVTWKSATNQDLQWLLSIQPNDKDVWMSTASVYSDTSTIVWSTPTQVVLSAEDLLRGMKGTTSVAVTLFSPQDNPSTASIQNVFCHPKKLKQGAANPWVVLNGTNESVWDQSNSIWKENAQPDGVLWKTSRVCTYDEDSNTLTGTPWTQPVKYIDIDGIIENAETNAQQAANDAIDEATQAIQQARQQAEDVTTAMTEAATQFAALKDEYEQNVTDSLNQYSNLTDKYTEYFGTGGKVETAIAELNKQVGNTDQVISDMQALGGYLNPYTPTLLRARTIDGEGLYVIGDIQEGTSTTITDGELSYKIKDDNNSVNVVNGKYLRKEDFTSANITGANSFFTKKGVVICGDFNASTKNLSNSYVVDPDNVKAELKEYKNYTNGVLSQWGLTGGGVTVGDGQPKVTSMQALFDTVSGKISTQVASATSGLSDTYATKTQLTQTAEQIQMAADSAKYIEQGKISDLAKNNIGTITVSDRYPLNGTIVLSGSPKNPTYNVEYYIKAYREDGTTFLGQSSKVVISEKTFNISKENITAVGTQGATTANYEGDIVYKVEFTNKCDQAATITLRYSVEAALASFGIGSSGIVAEVVSSIKSDTETINSIGSSVLSSTSFGTAVSSQLKSLTRATDNTQLAGIFGSLNEVTTTVAEWKSSGVNLSVMQSDLQVAKDKIEGTVIEAQLVQTDTLELTATTTGDAYIGTLTLPAKAAMKTSGSTTDYYNSPYYLIFDGGQLEYSTDNGTTWANLLSGANFDLGSSQREIKIRIKRNSSDEFLITEGNSTNKVVVKAGYNTVQAMSKSMQTVSSISNTILGQNGFASLTTTVDSIKGEVYSNEDDPQHPGQKISRIGTLESTSTYLMNIVGDQRSGSAASGTILNRIGTLELNQSETNFSYLKDIEITKGSTSAAFELPYDECSYQLQFADQENTTVSYILTADSNTTPTTGFTTIVGNGVINIDENEPKILWVKYEGAGGTNKLTVKVAVQTAVLISKITVTPHNIALSVANALGNSEEEELRAAMLNLSKNQITSVLTAKDGSGNTIASSSIIQSINQNKESSVQISADQIVLNGDVIAKAIATKSLNVDNLTYINSGSSTANKSVVQYINKSEVISVNKNTGDVYYNGGIDIEGAKNIKITPTKLYYDVKGQEGEFVDGNTSAIDFRIYRQSDDADLGGGACGDTIDLGSNNKVYITVQGDYDIIIANEIKETKEAGEEDINADDVIPTGVSCNISYEITAKDSISGVEYDGSSNVYPLMTIGCGTTGQSVFNSNGSGYFAGGLISWDKYRLDENGQVVIENGKKKTGGSSLVLDIQGIINAKAGTIAGWTLAAKGTAPSTHTHIFTRSLKSGNEYNYLDLSPDYGIRGYSSESLKGQDSGPFNYWLDVSGNAYLAQNKARFKNDGSFHLGTADEYIKFESGQLYIQGKSLMSRIGQAALGVDNGYINEYGALHPSSTGLLLNMFTDSAFNNTTDGENPTLTSWTNGSISNVSTVVETNTDLSAPPSGKHIKITYSSNVESIAPLIRQSITLQPGQYYTLSYYMKASTVAGNVGLIIYNSKGIIKELYKYQYEMNGGSIPEYISVIEGGFESGNSTFQNLGVNSGWTRYCVTFKTKDTLSSNTVQIGIGSAEMSSGTIYISSPKLELSMSPTEWINDTTVAASLISQSASSISAQVGSNMGLLVENNATYLSNKTCGFSINNNATGKMSSVFPPQDYNGVTNKGFLADGNIKWYTKNVGNSSINNIELKNVIADNVAITTQGTVSKVDTGALYFTSWRNVTETIAPGKTIQGASVNLEDDDPVILFKRKASDWTQSNQNYDFFVLNPLLLGNGVSTTRTTQIGCLTTSASGTIEYLIRQGIFTRYVNSGKIEKVEVTSNDITTVSYDSCGDTYLYMFQVTQGFFLAEENGIYIYVQNTSVIPTVDSIIEITRFKVGGQNNSKIIRESIYLYPAYEIYGNGTIRRLTDNRNDSNLAYYLSIEKTTDNNINVYKLSNDTYYTDQSIDNNDAIVMKKYVDPVYGTKMVYLNDSCNFYQLFDYITDEENHTYYRTEDSVPSTEYMENLCYCGSSWSAKLNQLN